MNLQKLSEVNLLSKHLLIACVKFFLMKGVITLRVLFEMLSDSEAFSFESLLMTCSICSAVTAKKMSSMWCVNTSLSMSLRFTYLLFEKNFFVRICVLKRLSLQLLFCFNLHNSEIWGDTCDLSAQSLLHWESLHRLFSWGLSEADVDSSMNYL